MRILLAGGSGFLGTHLRERLVAEGEEVVQLVRRPPTKPLESQWDPYAATVDKDQVAAADVVINLAGSPTVGNPHSKKWADNLLRSRVTTTEVLAQAIADVTPSERPAFLAGNGISWYGDHGTAPLPESRTDSRGNALLTRVTHQWQAAAQPAVDAGARVCFLRTAPVMDKRSDPLRMLHKLFWLGLGGRLGTGEQYFPMISTRDWVSAVAHLTASDVEGPANLCCEDTPTNREFTETLAAAVHRPAFMVVPGPVLDKAAGAMAPELLGSVRAVPRVLLDDGFAFDDPNVTAVLDAGLNCAD